MELSRRLKSTDARTRSHAFIAIAVLIVGTFLLGGSARGDEIGVLALRPLSVIALLVTLYLLSAEHIRSTLFVSAWVFAVFLLTVLHLVPLPPGLWAQLPGRDLVAQVDGAMGAAGTWRPLSMAPELTRNALWSMLAPLACYFLAIQLPRKDMFWFWCVVLGMGLLSGLISTIQISQGPESFLYFYRVTNFGLGVGFFANRNHQAVLLACLLPVSFGLLLIASRGRRLASMRQGKSIAIWAMVASGIFLTILILVTGSRSGLALNVLALVFIALFVWRHKDYFRGVSRERPGKPLAGKGFTQRKLALLALPLALVAAVVAVILAGRDTAFQRLSDTTLDAEARTSILGSLQAAIGNYFPFGSGIGSFDPVFRIQERADLLSPTYWNHAHNDWAEMAMTGGLPAVVLAVLGMGWLAKTFFLQQDKPSGDIDVTVFRFIALSIVALVLASSIVEYPLRVPVIACLFAVALAILARTRPGNYKF
jgi:hypothetical protein